MLKLSGKNRRFCLHWNGNVCKWKWVHLVSYVWSEPGLTLACGFLSSTLASFNYGKNHKFCHEKRNIFIYNRIMMKLNGWNDSHHQIVSGCSFFPGYDIKWKFEVSFVSSQRELWTWEIRGGWSTKKSLWSVPFGLMRFHHRKSSRWKTRTGFLKCFCRFLSDLFPLGYLDGSVSYSLCHLQSAWNFKSKKYFPLFLSS